MSQEAPRIVVLAGPNGAGKSTSAIRLLRGARRVEEYVNADTIASGLSALRPDGVAFLAGRIMLRRLDSLTKDRTSFAFETTLATRSYAPWLKSQILTGYEVDLIFLWLSSPELALARVADRVRRGGHGIPEPTVRRRYARGLRNFFELYRPLAHRWWVYDNSGTRPALIARGQGERIDTVRNTTAWQEVSKRAQHG